MLTYHFLKGLKGRAEDGGPMTVAGLYRYLKPKVKAEANLDNRSQAPEMEPMETTLAGSVDLR